MSSLVISPHQFPDLVREQALADEFGLDLVVAGDQDELLRALPDASVVMVTPYGRITDAEVAALRSCRGIVRYGVGYDNIDVRAASMAGIPVAIVPDASTEDVATHAFALGMTLARLIPQGQSAIQAGTWAAAVPFTAKRLNELEVGVVGMGRIGRRVAELWTAVGAKIAAYDPAIDLPPDIARGLSEILTESDIVTLHVPLLDATRNLISSETLATMRPSAVVVNVSRGGLVDEDALAAALNSSQIAGAGIDVFLEEPLRSDHPLRSAPNAVLTPHIAWKSSSSLGAIQAGAVERARAALSGQKMQDLVS